MLFVGRAGLKDEVRGRVMCSGTEDVRGGGGGSSGRGMLGGGARGGGGLILRLTWRAVLTVFRTGLEVTITGRKTGLVEMTGWVMGTPGMGSGGVALLLSSGWS